MKPHSLTFIFSTILATVLTVAFSGCGSHEVKLGEPVTAAFSADSNQQIVEINIHYGYEPNNIVARTGVPLNLIFGKSDGSCARELEIPEMGVKETLSKEHNTSVTLMSETPKIVPFHCSMKMMHGQIEFKAPEAE